MAVIETKGVSVPCTNMQVQATVLVVLLSNAGLKQLVSGVGASLNLQVLEYIFAINGTLRVR